MRLGECEGVVYVGGCVVVVGSNEVRMHRDGRWKVNPYSAELTGVEVRG